MSLTCYKSYSIDVTLVAQAWWTMENASPVSQPDSVQSLFLTRASGIVGNFTKVAGIVDEGVQIQPSVAAADVLSIVDEPALKFDGVGMALTFWLNFTDVAPTPNNSSVLVSYTFDQNGVYHVLTVSRSSGSAYSWRVFFDGAPLMARAAAAGWHFFVLMFNNSIGTVYFDIDQSGLGSQFVGVVAAGPNTTGDITLNVTSLLLGNELSVIFDEVALFPRILTTPQLNYLYNAGAGRTWPVTLP